MTREEQKTALTELEALLPKNFDTEMIIPEIKTPLYISSEDWSKGIIEVKGDVSHFQRADNPLVEIFRSASREYNGDLSKSEKFLFSALFPRYNASTGTTVCEFYANNISQAKKDLGAKAAKKRVQDVLIGQIGQTFQNALSEYFRDPNGFRKYQKFLAMIDYARNADEFDMLTSKANASIKAFIAKKKLPLPKKRQNGV